MAVYPNRIILKNSTDAQAAIESAIGSGGTDEIVYGEVVIGRESGGAKLYTLDSTGAVVVIGGGAAALGDLTDVDLTSTPPVNGNALLYNGVEWVPGVASTVGSLDDLTDVIITGASTGEVLRYNGSSWVDAQLSYSDLSNLPTLGTAAAAATTDFATAAQGTLADSAVQPTDSIDVLADVDTTTAAPTNGQVLQWNGTNWVPATAGGGGGGGVVSIDDLSDVDTTTVAPTDGQVLTWDNTAGQWEPATPSAAPVDSVAGKTGAVALELADNTDVDYGIVVGTVYDYLDARAISGGPSWTCPDDGAFSTLLEFSDRREINNYSSSGQSLEGVLNPTDGGTLWWATSPAGPYTQMTWTARQFSIYCANRRLYKLFGVTNGWPLDSSTTVDLYFLTSAPTPDTPTDGQVLTWNNANSQWQPATPSVVASIDDLTDVDTSTVAPTDGQALVWDNVAGQWEPADRVQSNATTGGAGSSPISNIVTISQVDYDALGTPDANTLYFIV